MQPDYTHVAILLDRSGSMASIKADTIGGFNTFIADQKTVPGKMTLTLSQFDNVYENLYDTIDIRAVQSLTDTTFVPRGSTALLDSTARLIIDTGVSLSKLKEDQRPGRVIVVILTDGEENSSHEQTKKTVAEMVKHQEEKYNWQFVYIGANQDAFAEGAAMGIKGVNYNASGAGTRAVYAGLTSNITANRAAPAGARVDLKQEEIDAAEKKSQ